MNRKYLIFALPLILMGCREEDVYTPRNVCVEKVNMRIETFRGMQTARFDCNRYILTCIEPLELYSTIEGIIKCRLPRIEVKNRDH